MIWFLIFPKPAATDSDEVEDPSTEEKDARGDCPCELETYGPEIDAGYIKSPNYPHFDGCDGRCTYIVSEEEDSSGKCYLSDSPPPQQKRDPVHCSI